MTHRLLTQHHLAFQSIKEAAQSRLSLHLSKCHSVGNHMSWFIYTAFLKACLIHICMAINFKDKVQTVNMITETNLL